MKVIITCVKCKWFNKTYEDIKTFENWKHEFLPNKDDSIVIDDATYYILQRRFYDPDLVKFFVEKLF